MKKILMTLSLLCSSCTYSINMTHTQGTATDVGDESITPSTSVSVPVNIPKPL